jgi:hypothetical protein
MMNANRIAPRIDGNLMAPQTQLPPEQSSFPVASLSPAQAGKPRLPRILSVGRDTSLLSTNAAILTAAGFAVRSAAPEEASDLVIVNYYCIAVFDQSLSDVEAAELATSARVVNPRTKLLLIIGSKTRPHFIEVLFDVIVHHSEFPGALTRFIELTAQEISIQPKILGRLETAVSAIQNIQKKGAPRWDSTKTV